VRNKLFALLAILICSGCIEQTADELDVVEPAVDQQEVFGRLCWRPVRAVLETLECVQSEDAACAADGYAPGFVKLHNGIDTNTVISGPEYWAGAFQLIDIDLDINHVARVSRDEISLRYVETVTFITGDVFYQHEHALITVDEDCKMTLWDQYGDNAEQKAIDDKVIEILGGVPQP